MCTPTGEFCAFLGGGGSGLVLMCYGTGMGEGVLETSLPASHPDSSSRIVESPCVYKMPTLARSMHFLGTEL